MKKRILGLALAIALIISLLPAVTVLPVKAAAVSKTVGLWGANVTVDNDDSTADIKDAYYWVNDGENVPKEATAADDWNYSYAIIDGVATLTLKNAEFKNASYLLSISKNYGGALNIVYKGVNNIQRTGSNGAVISASSNNANKPYVKFIGGKDDVLNLSGNKADSWVVSLNFGNHNDETGSRVAFIGGNVNITRTNNGKYGAFSVTGANVLIEDCNLKVTSKKAISALCHAAVQFVPDVNSKDREIMVRNSTFTIETSCIMGLLLGSNSNGTLGAKFNDIHVEGSKSKISITVANTYGSAAYARGGIVAKDIIMNGGALEVKATTSMDGATMNAVVLKGEGVTAPDMSGYVGEYNMYLEEEGEPVTAFAASNYFKVAFKPCAAHAGKVTDCTKDVACTNPGCPENFYTAPAGAAHEADADDGDCTTGIKCKNCDVIVTAGQASHKDTRTNCDVAGTCANAGCTHAFTAGQHNPAADDGDCTTDIKCASCNKVVTKGQAEHKYTDKNDTTCDNAGCTKTRTVEGTENPKTGDTTALVLMATLMVAAAAAFVTSKKFVR